MGTKGAIFSLVLRDERFDAFFTASDMLRERLNAVRAARALAGEKDVQPTLADVERTHVLYMRSQYKPYVAVASEYSAVKASGDGARALTGAGGSVQFVFPAFGHFTSDMVLRVRLAAVGTATPVPADLSAGPSPQPVPFTGSPMYRYCAYPGVRLLQRVEFRSNATPIDEYTPDDVLLNAKFFIANDYAEAFAKDMGQQTLKQATYYNQQGYTGVLPYYDGAQTPKFLQPALEMFIPLQFDMCKEPGRALVNDLIPNTQRVVNIDLAPLQQILQAVDQQLDPPQVYPQLPVSSLRIEDMTLLVNNLYVNPEIHDIFASRIGFQLFRVHRRQLNNLQVPKGAQLLNQLKYPVEYLMAGIRDKANALSFDNWPLMGRAPTFTPETSLLAATYVWNSTLGMAQLVARTAQPGDSLAPLMETAGLIAHGVVLFPEQSTRFFNSYLTYRYPTTTNTVSPVDAGAIFIPLCLFPGEKDPSGYYNFSTGREVYLVFSASQVSAQAPAELVVCASTLNFLIKSGDSVALRYSL